MKIILKILCLLLTSGLAAQSFDAGLKGGGNATFLRGDNSEDLTKEVKPAFHAGIYGNLIIGDVVGLQTEFIYSSKGSKNFNDSSDTELNLNYLTVPVLLQIWPSDHFNIYGGPQFGFLTAARQITSKKSENVKDSFKSGEFSVVGGIGYVSDNGIRVYFRYDHGIAKINDAKFEFGNLKNSALQLGVGFNLVNR